MEQWYCFKCKEKITETEIMAEYLGMVLPVMGLKCPKCGLAFFTEKTTVEEIAKGEADLEEKMG